MIFFLLLLILMFAALVVQHFIGVLQYFGCRVLLMQMVMLALRQFGGGPVTGLSHAPTC